MGGGLNIFCIQGRSHTFDREGAIENIFKLIIMLIVQYGTVYTGMLRESEGIVKFNI